MGKHWCFTLNNFTEEDILVLDVLPCKYGVFGYEVGANGTPHIQGYVEFNKNVRFKKCKELLGGRAHVELRKGSRDQAREYCMKDKDFQEVGVWEGGGQGRRADLSPLEGLMKTVEEAPRDVLSMMRSAPEDYSKHMKFLAQYNSAIEREATKKFRHLTVEVIWGKPGFGKSGIAREKANFDIYSSISNNPMFMFNDYNGEPALLIDDFYGKTIDHDELLKILDGYQYQVNVKYVHRYTHWTKVFITSNSHPDEWYRGKYPDGIWPNGVRDATALGRRITAISELKIRHRFDDEGHSHPVCDVDVPSPGHNNVIRDLCDTADHITCDCDEVAGNTRQQLPSQGVLEGSKSVTDDEITSHITLSQTQFIPKDIWADDNIMDPDIEWLLSGI